MSTLKIGIADYEEMKARTMAIARGELRPTGDDPKIWFTSTESFAKILSAGNRALLAVIASKHPESIQELAEFTGRAKSNLSRTLRRMEAYGLVQLRQGEGRRLKPVVMHDRIELELQLTANPVPPAP